MRKLNIPTDDPIEVFETCISKVQNADLKERLSNCKTKLTEATKDYNIKAPDGLLHTIPTHNSVNGNVSTEEMKKVYTDRMVGIKSPGRHIYDKWINSAPNNICPLCAQRTVKTLDHHLPKAHFPIYSVAPINIFPACIDCNKNKLNTIPTSPENELIHPYFDDFDDFTWLKAKVMEKKPASVKYYTEKPDSWDEIKYKRIENHFNMLELDTLYASHSGVELTINNLRLNDLFETGGVDSVKEFLEESYHSMKAVNLNSWQTALYHALLNSTWFQEGGFKN